MKVTKILPHLYLGNMKDASDRLPLERLRVGYILNVTSQPPPYKFHPGIQYKQLQAADNGLQNLLQFFEEAFDFIDLAKENNSSALVHCQAGISRSPTIAVAYIMKNNPSLSLAEAYKFVKAKRSIISPNLNFMAQLWEYEQILHKTRTMNNPDVTRSTSAGKKRVLMKQSSLQWILNWQENETGYMNWHF